MDSLSLVDASPEHKFMFMLLERVDYLSDSINKIEMMLSRILQVIPPLPDEYECKDMIEIYNNEYSANASKCYFKISLKSGFEYDHLETFLINHPQIQSILIYNCSDYLLYDDIEKDDHNSTVQFYIDFTSAVYILRFVEELYKNVKDYINDKKILINPVLDMHVSVYYEKMLTACILNIDLQQASNVLTLPIKSKKNIERSYSMKVAEMYLNQSNTCYVGYGNSPTFYLVLLPKSMRLSTINT